MSTYLVSYDLSKPERNYPKVEKFLKTLPWAHALGSVWFVRSALTAHALAQKLLECVDSDDHFVVTPVDLAHTVWYNLAPDVSDWLQGKAA